MPHVKNCIYPKICEYIEEDRSADRITRVCTKSGRMPHYTKECPKCR